MPYIDLRDNKDGIYMIETVQKHFYGFPKREIKKAQLSRTFERRIGHPPDGRFKKIVCLGQNGLQNCPIEAANIDNSNAMFGPNRSRLKVATVQIKAQRTKEQ